MRLSRLLIACFLSLGLAAHAQQEELLPAEEAFALHAVANGPGEIVLTWNIAPDYYMYGHRFGVKLLRGDAELGALSIPPGKKKSDEFFGETEIHTRKVSLSIPITRRDANPMAIGIEALGQGCNEPIGVCYPPITHEATLQLAALNEPPATAEISSLSALRDLLGGDIPQQEFLDPDQAFKFDLAAKDPGNLLARFDVAPGYYLYQHKLGFSSTDPDLVLGDYELPPGVEKEDEYFGKTVTYTEPFSIQLPFSVTDRVDQASFDVTYQGCADQGICYPPIEKTVLVDLLPISAAQAAEPPPPDGGGGAGADPGGGYLWPVILAFAAGLALTFTPCVLPMIPILASIIVGQGGDTSKVKGGALAGAYVLGTAATYTVIGVFAGYTGDQLQAYFQNPWAIGIVALILAGLALSMFGLYEIQMPSVLQSRLQANTRGLRGGTLGGVFVMGLVSALIVGACVSPVLMTVLGLAIERADPVLGGAIMFSMALGMGVILIAMGLGAGVLLPRAGPWMESVKHVFGVLLLAVAIYLLGVLPEVPVLYLWAGLFIVCAVYLGALQSLPDGVSGWRYLWKGLGVVLLIWGVLALVGGMAGNRDIMQPVDVAALTGATGSHPDAARTRPHVEFVKVSDVAQLDRQLALAKARNKPVMLDYYADWCVDCIRMEKSTFQDAGVADILRTRFLLLQVDVTDPRDAGRKAIKTRYGVFGPPAMLFFDAAGNELKGLRRYGFMNAAEFMTHISDLI